MSIEFENQNFDGPENSIDRIASSNDSDPVRDRNVDGLTIVLMRPGLTELDEQGRIVGTLDVPLSAQGEIEAANLAKKLAVQRSTRPIDLIYSGPSAAARETAAVLGKTLQSKVKVIDGLVNLDHGLWQGMKMEDLRTNQPRLVRQWEEFPESVCPPAGEPVEDVLRRVEKFLKRVIRKFKKGNVVVVVPEPMTSVIGSVLKSERIGELLKAQAQNSGIEYIEVVLENVGAIDSR